MKKKKLIWVMLILACVAFAGQTLYACGCGGSGCMGGGSGGSGDSSESTTSSPEV
ncbi:MAG: hypothetical protein H6757_05665 [Candidatus Omnitrophica bacterium]|nr:hypothetical protein [Candidatus Omnitrophota bacterium]